MGVESFAKSTFGGFFIRVLAAGMESRFRYRFFGPMRIITGAAIQPNQIVLEVGCGTGYFTVPAAGLIGERGQLVSLDITTESIKAVSKRVHLANLTNVRLVRGDAMDSGLDAESFDKVLLFGVIPAPMMPLSRLLPEMHRILKPEGGLAVWPSIPGWLPQSIVKTGLFTFSGKCNGVHNFSRV
jgi:demethylmenaquinone methyltransferase/2-methoxy-6-polyprenyl-1,4-benzoquinol methylase